MKKNHEEVQEVQKPLALEVGLYGKFSTRAEELVAVGKAYSAGYTEVLESKDSDEVIYLVAPEHLHGTVLDHLDCDTLEASLSDYFKLVNVYDWVETQGKVEEVTE